MGDGDVEPWPGGGVKSIEPAYEGARLGWADPQDEAKCLAPSMASFAPTSSRSPYKTG